MKKRKKLGAEELYREIGTVFDRVPEERRHLGNVSISIRDSLFSGLAIFAMKFGSLLKFLGGHILISLDGSGHFSSSKIRCENCIKKVRRTGGDRILPSNVGSSGCAS